MVQKANYRKHKAGNKIKKINMFFKKSICVSNYKNICTQLSWNFLLNAVKRDPDSNGEGPEHLFLR